MTLLSLLEFCSDWAPIVFVRDSKFGMPAVQSLHLMGLTLLLATVLVLNLRLAGMGMTELGMTWLARQLRPWTLGAIALVIASGLLIFIGTPGKYLGSHAFQLKMTLLCAALVFHFAVLHRFVTVDSDLRRRTVKVLVACLSLALWFGVGWAGRAIAFLP